MGENQAETGLANRHGPLLLDVARRSIAHGLSHQAALPIDPDGYSEELRQPRATFVTLRIKKALRGCMGSLESIRPAVEDIAANAFSAAFRDPRFTPLTVAEYSSLRISLSILSPPEEIDFDNEEDLLAAIEPGVDGLILRLGAQRGLLLPSVWQMLPDPRMFLSQLKKKAGLAEAFWSNELICERFTAESIA